MLEAVFWILGIALFLVVIMGSIAVHEAGHMLVAKKLGIPVPKFFVGFGKTLWSIRRGETEYGVKAIPLGGFVLIEDPAQPEGSPERSLLSHVAPWRRFLIFVAGPVVNIVIGTVIFFFLLLQTPVFSPTTTIAKCAGTAQVCQALRPGDTLVAVNGKEVASFTALRESLTPHSFAEVQVKRGEALETVTVPVSAQGKLGITMTSVERPRTAGGAVSTMATVFNKSLHTLASVPTHVPQVAKALVGLEERNPEGISSVVGVGRAYGETVATEKLASDDKIRTLISYTALLNIGLGLANLLPLLPLDGGRILIAFFDSLRGAWARVSKKEYSPLGYSWVSAMTVVTGVMVLGYMALLIAADIFVPLSIY